MTESVISIIDRQRKHQRAFTLIESMLAAVIVAIVAAALLLPFNSAVQTKNYSMLQTRAKASAEEIMETVLSMSFQDPDCPTCRNLGPDSGEVNWRYYDNIDDWNSYSDTVSQDGQQTLSRSVAVSYRTLAGQVLSGSGSVCEIVVTVSDSNSNELLKLSRIVYADLEM